MRTVKILFFLATLILFNANCGKKVKFGQLNNDRTVAVAFLPNGNMVVGSDVYQNNNNRATVKIIDAENWTTKELGAFDGGTTDAFAIDPEGKYVVAASNNARLLRTWKLENNQMQTLGEDISQRDIIFVSNDSFVSVGSNALRLWNLGDKNPKILFKCLGLEYLAYSKTLNLLATNCDDSYKDNIGQRIMLLEFSSGQMKENQKLSEIRANRLIFSPDEKI